MTTNKAGIEALLTQMRENYFRELPEKFNELESLALKVPDDASGDTFETLYRHTHSLKGTAGTYGYNLITTICHHLEDCYYKYKQGGDSDPKANLELWLRHIDLLRDAHGALAEEPADTSVIEARLQALLHSYEQYEYRGLLVAESALDVSMVQQAFKTFPVGFSVVHDGLHAMERLLVDRFDFYVLTHQLPRLNGPSIVTAIRTNMGINRKAPCLLISGSKLVLHGRDVDPDFVVLRNSNFTSALEAAAKQLVAKVDILRVE